MTSGRNAKRARQKERRNMRRSEWESYLKKRRRQRRGVLLATLAVLVAAGAVGYLVLFAPKHKTPAAKPSASPAATTKAKQYSKPADQHLDPDKTNIWRLETNLGTIDVALDVKHSPKTSNSVAFLTRKGFYDNTPFHRITKQVVIQGGDPTGSGTGGPGYQVVEKPPSTTKYTEGVVAMAKGGQDPPGASGSQFFITLDSPGFTPDYAVLGKVTADTMKVVKKIESRAGVEPAQDMQAPPKIKVRIKHATIVIE